MRAARLSTKPPAQARDRLLDVATLLFAGHGYHAIGLRDLAAHLGLHAGSLYHHIENKQGLLFELIESTLADLLFATRRQVKGAKGRHQRLCAFVRVFVEFSLSEQDRLTLLVRDLVYLTAEQARQIAQLKRAYIALLAGIVEAEPGLHERERAAHVTASAIVGMLFGQSQWPVDERPAARLSDDLSSMALALVENARRVC